MTETSAVKEHEERNRQLDISLRYMVIGMVYMIVNNAYNYHWHGYESQRLNSEMRLMLKEKFEYEDYLDEILDDAVETLGVRNFANSWTIDYNEGTEILTVSVSPLMR